MSSEIEKRESGLAARGTNGPAIEGTPEGRARDATIDFGRAWEYAPAPEATDFVAVAPRQDLFVGGRWRAPKSGKYVDTLNPSTESKLAEVAEAGERDVDDAVQAARLAYEAYWSKMRPAERGKYIFRIARAIQEKARELAIVESMN